MLQKWQQVNCWQWGWFNNFYLIKIPGPPQNICIRQCLLNLNFIQDSLSFNCLCCCSTEYSSKRFFKITKVLIIDPNWLWMELKDKGELAVECWTGTWLVSPSHGQGGVRIRMPDWKLVNRSSHQAWKKRISPKKRLGRSQGGPYNTVGVCQSRLVQFFAPKTCNHGL